MSWLTNYVRPKLQGLVGDQDIPENLWVRCPECGAMMYHKELDSNYQICNQCNHHFRLTPTERFKLLFDNEEYTEIELPEVKEDPIKFSDLKSYNDRLKIARKTTNQQDAIRIAHGKMGNMSVVIGVFNFDFMGGSMGTAVGEAIVRAAELATLQEATLILVTASGGARMQEGMLSLVQMARTTTAIRQLKEKGLPYFVVLTDPTSGGVSASFAMLGDFQLAEPGAIIAFAGKRVIEQTIHTQLPDDFQKAEYLKEHGMVDKVVDRRQLRDTIITLNELVRVPNKIDL
ncbi:MAG: acetyl-CoA carboxylase, carboxyltransferase subunit beta [Alphaproteobacteria bacterium]|nr:acetyl-CoA carboxylase, carboxyltransferase subunit beta [Alphaproteobacteria bacterium]